MSYSCETAATVVVRPRTGSAFPPAEARLDLTVRANAAEIFHLRVNDGAEITLPNCAWAVAPERGWKDSNPMIVSTPVDPKTLRAGANEVRIRLSGMPFEGAHDGAAIREIGIRIRGVGNKEKPPSRRVGGG